MYDETQSDADKMVNLMTVIHVIDIPKHCCSMDDKLSPIYVRASILWFFGEQQSFVRSSTLQQASKSYSDESMS